MVQDQLDTFVYKALGQTVSSIAKGASKSNWFPEAPLSDTVSSYMEQLVTMLQVRTPPQRGTPTPLSTSTLPALLSKGGFAVCGAGRPRPSVIYIRHRAAAWAPPASVAPMGRGRELRVRGDVLCRVRLLGNRALLMTVRAFAWPRTAPSKPAPAPASMRTARTAGVHAGLLRRGTHESAGAVVQHVCAARLWHGARRARQLHPGPGVQVLEHPRRQAVRDRRRRAVGARRPQRARCGIRGPRRNVRAPVAPGVGPCGGPGADDAGVPRHGRPPRASLPAHAAYQPATYHVMTDGCPICKGGMGGHPSELCTSSTVQQGRDGRLGCFAGCASSRQLRFGWHLVSASHGNPI